MLFLLISVTFVAGFKLVHGQSQGSRFRRLDFVPGQSDAVPSNGRLLMSFSGAVEAKLIREGSLPLFYLDVLGATVDVNPFLLNLPQGPVKLVRLSQLSAEPAVLRATFFMRRSYKPEARQTRDGIEISFSDASPEKPETRSSYTLIAPPQDDTSRSASAPQSKQLLPELKQTRLLYSDKEASSRSESESVLLSADSENLQVNVVDAEAAGLLTELARQMKKTIHFRDIFDTRVTVNIAAADPMQVMQQVAALVGGQISVEDGEVWVSRRQNPILRISDTDSVEGADLSTLALGDVLRALGQLAELNIALDVSLDSIKDRHVDVYLQKTSVRRAFETLLKIHSLTLKLIDDRTLMVMTAEKARSLEGKVFRVVKIDVPFEKLKTLLEQSLSVEISGRLSIQEDLGNFILTGDKEAVDQAVSVIKSAETKLISAGTSHIREYFQPLNTKPEELIGLVKDSISESENVRLFHDKRTDMILVSGPANSVERAMKIVRRLDLEPTRQALIHIRLIEISRSDLDRMGISFPEQLAAVSDIGKLHNATVVIPATFRGFTENSKVKTLANPTIRCMDREEASIDISEQIPVKNTVTEYLPIASASLAARTSDNWTTSETGIKLNIKPTIHKDNEISMKVDVDLTELIRLVEGHPWTARRVVKTMVRVKDKETVVIGGLIRKKTDKRRNPVPVLSKIPFLRRLVKGLAYRDDNKEESEMVILITPVLVGSGGIDPAIVETSNAAELTTVMPDARN
ncbi:MAG: hypothetical protein CVV41_17050 [Candidatus Riflebacteria bacterium HGW-Riflebacteria-1]|jgi:type II secretory pathway component GspD/PulD (secretin)|nr:MAG: hypothetical protein CVV41_17050 [Candidatus Riflebacteria bacterium HGW-Riflebacteria-1]